MRLQTQRLTHDRSTRTYVNIFILAIAVLLPFIWLAPGAWTLPIMSALNRLMLFVSRIDVVSVVFLGAFLVSSALLTFGKGMRRPEPAPKAPAQFTEPKVDFYLLQDDMLAIPDDKQDGPAA